MIDPTNITNFNLTTAELETRILWWVAAAGKNGVVAARCLEKFIINKTFKYGNLSPFELIRRMGQRELVKGLACVGMGCYTIKARTFRELADSNINLKTCTIDDLEKIKGIGPKTSRCFLIHSRPNQRLAGLDTHNLKYLKSLGYTVPKSTPSGKKYKQIEQLYLQEVDKSGKDIATFDLEIWNKYRVSNKAKK